tara:strand:+ start:2650 stop:3012 length:363 start_codon:yes stop_codon:yes gene_type:complete
MRNLTFEEHMLFPSNLEKMKKMARIENFRLMGKGGLLEDTPEIAPKIDYQTQIFNVIKKKKKMRFQEIVARTNIDNSKARGFLIHLIKSNRVSRFKKDGLYFYQAILESCPKYRRKHGLQ